MVDYKRLNTQGRRGVSLTEGKSSLDRWPQKIAIKIKKGFKYWHPGRSLRGY